MLKTDFPNVHVAKMYSYSRSKRHFYRYGEKRTLCGRLIHVYAWVICGPVWFWTDQDCSQCERKLPTEGNTTDD